MDIKKLLIEREQMTLTDLSRHFYVSESVMSSMMDKWINKGKVSKEEQSGLCGTSCGSCSESSEVKIYYRWRKVAQKPIFAQQK